MAERGKVVRTRDAARLEQLRELLRVVTGSPVSASKALDSAVKHMTVCLGGGDDLATFSVSALQKIMHDRTASLTGGIAQAVAAAVTEYLREAGVDAELRVGLSADGRRIAARLVSHAPLPEAIGDDRLHPQIEA